MGGDLSKSKDVTEHVTESTWSSQDSPPLMKYDEWMLQVITEDLEKDTEMFVVNNMLMSVQFLENYEKEVLDEAILETENELNKTLLKELKLSFIKPDHVLEVVNQKVRFVPSPTVSQESTSAIASRRVYVVNTMFDVVSTFEEHQYTTVDKPIYRVKLEQSTHTTDKQNKKIPGYLRLKLTEHTHFTDCPVSSALKKTKDFKDPDLTSSESASSNHHPKAKPDVAEYDVIIKNNTPKPINVEASMLKDCLPLYCFTTQLNEKRATDICMQSEEVNGNLAQIKLFDKTIYVDAQGYMRYFKNNIFPKSLGRNLGFSDREVQVQARSIRGKVLCKSEGQGNDIFECEIIPCVLMTLPADLKFNFEKQGTEQNTQNISQTNNQNLYKWPTEQMMKKIQHLACVLTPKGYWKKNTQHKPTNLEWEISFPNIEKYLFSKMSHTQIRCYLFILLIHKAHIQPKTKYQGLQVEHIRHHILWECSKNFVDWPEHRLGYKLREVIENLMIRISKQHLPDYFIKGKNLFENIPIKFLYIASEELQNILEQPAMCLINILRKVSYVSSQFFKELDVKGLMKMLHSSGLEIATEQLPVPTENGNVENLQKYSNPETRVNYIKLQKRRYAKAQLLQKTARQKVMSDESSESKVRNAVKTLELNFADCVLFESFYQWKREVVLSKHVLNCLC
ncbi:unnamed protein product [Callosobruchus maculatus]|uniref:Mab-21-like HhH/H2TH-like domain-containing protein n=1 Tax=Callosobruchus maculatus TaxID=64391 RepID=A0A653BJS4_CALMS|nr:unnamed protein product [Callosobruchus maculatus]